MSDLDIFEVFNNVDYARCVQIRTLVFVVGQQVPPDREIDKYENECHHYLALLDGIAVGTVRWRKYSDGIAKIERLAVMFEARGKQVGSKLMNHVLQEIAKRPELQRITLGSQDHAIPFYTALGFEIDGEGFEDVGIPHHNMGRLLK